MTKNVNIRDWNSLPAILPIPLVALMFNKTPECIRRWAADGKIPASRMPDGWLIDKEVLRSWFDDNGNEVAKKVVKERSANHV